MTKNIFQRFSRVGPRGRAREWATLGVHPLSWLLSNNRLEEVCGTLTKDTFSSRLLLSNQDKGCTPSVAHSLPLPLGFCSTCQLLTMLMGKKILPMSRSWDDSGSIISGPQLTTYRSTFWSEFDSRLSRVSQSLWHRAVSSLVLHAISQQWMNACARNHKRVCKNMLNTNALLSTRDNRTTQEPFHHHHHHHSCRCTGTRTIQVTT